MSCGHGLVLGLWVGHVGISHLAPHGDLLLPPSRAGLGREVVRKLAMRASHDGVSRIPHGEISDSDFVIAGDGARVRTCRSTLAAWRMRQRQAQVVSGTAWMELISAKFVAGEVARVGGWNTP